MLQRVVLMFPMYGRNRQLLPTISFSSAFLFLRSPSRIAVTVPPWAIRKNGKSNRSDRVRGTPGNLDGCNVEAWVSCSESDSKIDGRLAGRLAGWQAPNNLGTGLGLLRCDVPTVTVVVFNKWWWLRQDPFGTNETKPLELRPSITI